MKVDGQKIEGGKGQTQTIARYKALCCIRMAVQQACMKECYLGVLPDIGKFNVDASTGISHNNGAGAAMYRVVSCRQGDYIEAEEYAAAARKASLLKDPITSIRFQDSLNIFLKWMQLNGGEGDFGQVCLIVAVPGMPEGSYHFQRIAGLTNGTDSTVTGALYFAPTRCMKGKKSTSRTQATALVTTSSEDSDNDMAPTTQARVGTTAAAHRGSRRESDSDNEDGHSDGDNQEFEDWEEREQPEVGAAAQAQLGPEALATIGRDSSLPANGWNHYFRYILVPDILKLQDSTFNNGILDEDNQRFGSCCSIDGEATINCELLEPSVYELFAEHDINVIKNRPSCTQFDNACDASDNFRDKNTGLRELAKKNVDTTCKSLQHNLKAAFTSLRAAFPQVTMSVTQQNKAETAIMRFVYMGKQKYVTAIKARIGAERAGDVISQQYPNIHPITGRENSTVNFEYILTNLCYTSLEEGDLENIRNHAPEMIAETRRVGRLSNEFMDDLNIAKLPEGEHRDRDMACLAQQGPVCLTHAATRAREEAYAQRKIQAAHQASVDRAQALIDSNAQAARKLAEANARKIAETARISQLSPEAKAAEIRAKKAADLLKKIAATLAKEEKARIVAERLQAAHALVAAAAAGARY